VKTCKLKLCWQAFCCFCSCSSLYSSVQGCSCTIRHSCCIECKWCLLITFRIFFLSSYYWHKFLIFLFYSIISFNCGGSYTLLSFRHSTELFLCLSILIFFFSVIMVAVLCFKIIQYYVQVLPSVWHQTFCDT